VKNSNSAKQRWRGRLAVASIVFFGRWPLAINRLIGVLVGWCLWVFPNDNRSTAKVNLDLCFPHQSAKQKARLLRQSLRETGKSTLEIAYVWRNPQRALTHINRVEGLALLEQAQLAKRAVVILAPHHGCWELLNYWVSQRYPFHVLYSPSGLDAVDRLIAQSREAFQSVTHPATARGIVGLVRALKQGNMTGILPDQVPDRKSTHFAPFFDQPASTPSLACRLVQQTNAVAFCCFVKRLPGVQGFDVIIRQADTGIYSNNLNTALAAMNRSIEALIREAPEQYLWSYKRFRRRPHGEPNPYQQ